MIKQAELQFEYCKKNKLPFFIPSDGCCFCGANIFAGDRAISDEVAASRLITGCQYCKRSFVD